MGATSPLAISGSPALYTSLGPTSTPGGFSGASFGTPGLPFGFGYPSYGDPFFYAQPACTSFNINRLLGYANGSAVNVNIGPVPSTLGFGQLLLGAPFFGGGGIPGGGPFAAGSLGSFGGTPPGQTDPLPGFGMPGMGGGVPGFPGASGGPAIPGVVNPNLPGLGQFPAAAAGAGAGFGGIPGGAMPGYPGLGSPGFGGSPGLGGFGGGIPSLPGLGGLGGGMPAMGLKAPKPKKKAKKSNTSAILMFILLLAAQKKQKK